MIHTHLHWSDDMSKAPRGEYVTTTRTVLRNGKPVDQMTTEFVPAFILAVSKTGVVHRTHWVPEKRTSSGEILTHGRWSGFAETPEFRSDPVAWALWPDGLEIVASFDAINSVETLPLSEVDA